MVPAADVRPLLRRQRHGVELGRRHLARRRRRRRRVGPSLQDGLDRGSDARRVHGRERKSNNTLLLQKVQKNLSLDLWSQTKFREIGQWNSIATKETHLAGWPVIIKQNPALFQECKTYIRSNLRRKQRKKRTFCVLQEIFCHTDLIWHLIWQNSQAKSSNTQKNTHREYHAELKASCWTTVVSITSVVGVTR